jgi:hypothetical protein
MEYKKPREMNRELELKIVFNKKHAPAFFEICGH